MKKFGFFNSVNGDRKYLASDISNAFNIALGTGLAPLQDCFKIIPNEKMTVKMKTGGGMIYGCYISDDEEEIIQLDTAHSELNRIDRIALRYDKFERSIKTVVVKGTPALNPTAPTPLKTENQFDLVLADVRINKAVTEIKEANIVDMRDSDLCGFLGGKVLEENIQGYKQSVGNISYRIFAGGMKIVIGEYKTPSGGSDGKSNGAFYKVISNLALPVKFANKDSMKVFVNSTSAWAWANGTANTDSSINLIVSNPASAAANNNVGLYYLVVGY